MRYYESALNKVPIPITAGTGIRTGLNLESVSLNRALKKTCNSARIDILSDITLICAWCISAECRHIPGDCAILIFALRGFLRAKFHSIL